VKSLSIIIPIHNRLETTKEGLITLYEALDHYRISGKGSLSCHVIIIDDGSTDGSYDWISNNFKEIHLLKGNGKLWWTGSINKGAHFAIANLKSDYLLLWNDDVSPKLDYFIIIENLINDNYTTNTIIGSKIICKKFPNKIWSVGGFYNKLTGHFFMSNEIKDESKFLIECDWQPGMGTIIPTTVIKSFGLIWDAVHFPQYHGDSDFTLRCKSKGIRIITYLGLVLHNNTETTGFINKKQNLHDLYESFTSLKSGYNIRVNFQFYLRHGYFPFAYLGMLLKYFFYIGGYFKHSLIRLFHFDKIM